jgi:hypothetical protein
MLASDLLTHVGRKFRSLEETRNGKETQEGQETQQDHDPEESRAIAQHLEARRLCRSRPASLRQTRETQSKGENDGDEETQEVQETHQDDHVEGLGSDAAKDLRRFTTAKD